MRLIRPRDDSAQLFNDSTHRTIRVCLIVCMHDNVCTSKHSFYFGEKCSKRPSFSVMCYSVCVYPFLNSNCNTAHSVDGKERQRVRGLNWLSGVLSLDCYGL